MRIAGYQVGDAWWNRAALAGLVGGIGMALYEMIAAASAGRGVWWPMNLVGGALPFFRPAPPGISDPHVAVVLPNGGLALPSPGIFWPGTTAGIALHLLTSMVWGLLYGLGVAVLAALFINSVARSWTFGALAGIGWGLVTWIIMGLILGPYVSPSLVLAAPMAYFIGHMVFGLVTGLTFTALTRRPRVSVTFAPRAAVRDELTTRR